MLGSEREKEKKTVAIEYDRFSGVVIIICVAHVLGRLLHVLCDLQVVNVGG